MLTIVISCSSYKFEEAEIICEDYDENRVKFIYGCFYIFIVLQILNKYLTKMSKLSWLLDREKLFAFIVNLPFLERLNDADTTFISVNFYTTLTNFYRLIELTSCKGN